MNAADSGASQRAQIEGFLRVIHQIALDRDGNYDPEYELELRPIDQARKIRHGYMGFPSVGAASAAAVRFDGQGLDGYYGVSLRKRGSAKGGDAAAAAFAVAFADIDCDKHEITRERALEVLAQCPWGKPAVIVDSGGGLHPFWLYRELLTTDDPANVTLHQKTQRFIRWYLNDKLGAVAADDMSSRDRILRLPGTHNQKPERRRPDGTQPQAFVRAEGVVSFVEAEHILEFQPHDIKWDHVVREAQALDPDSLPTQIPERIKRIVAAAGLRLAEVKRLAGGQIHAMVLQHCPACGDAGGKGRCYITPSGRMKTLHQVQCPAAGQYTRDAGLELKHWVALYAPQAKGAMADDREVGQLKRPMEHRVAIAWNELAVEAGESTARAWASAAGLHPELGDEAIEVGLLLCPVPALVDAGASRLAMGIANDRRRDEALVPIQDIDGNTRLAAWISTEGRVRVLSGFDVETLGDLPDVLGVLGSVPTAVEAGAAGRMVVVTDDARDWLTAQAMRHAGALDAEVLGVLRDKDVPKLARALKSAWTRMGALPRRVVLLRRREKKGTLAVEAAKRLAGRAGVAICDLTVPEKHQGGLTESAATFGPESAARAVKTAAWTHEPPVDINTAGPAMRAFLEQSVALAATKSTHKRHKVVINVIDAGGGKTTAMIGIAARVAAGLIPVPVVGNRPHRIPAAQWPPEGRRVGFWLPTHALAAEKEAQFQVTVRSGGLPEIPTVNSVHLKGALEWCAFSDHVRDVFPVVGRRGICGDPDSEQRCPEAEMGCLGAIEPRIEFDQIAFGAHAMAGNVRQDLAIVDENPGVFDGQAVDGAALATLFTPRVMHRIKRWRLTENPDCPTAARLLSDALQAHANELADDVGAGRADGYDKHIRGEDLVRLIDKTPGLAEALRVGAHKDARKPPVPFPNELRAGAFTLTSYPSRAAFFALQALQNHYLRLKGEKTPAEEDIVVLDNAPKAPEPMVVFTLRTDRTYEIRQYRVRTLPDCPTIILDATGEVTMAEWKAAYPDREVIVRRMRVQGAAPAMALHLETKQFRRRRIWGRDGVLTDKTAARLRSTIVRTVLETRRRAARKPQETPTVGVLLYKGLYDLIAGIRPPGTPAEALVAGVAQLCADMNVRPLWGYFGKHDRGTNEFERVDGLAVIGDPLENVGQVELQASMLSLESDKIGRARAMATLIQSMFRARHTRRGAEDPVVLVHVGERPPDIDGLDWETEPLIEHERPATAGKLALAYAAVEYVAEQLEDVIGAKIMAWYDFSGSPFGRKLSDEIDDRTWRDACRRYAHARGLVDVQVALTDRRPAVFFGPTAEDVQNLVDHVFCLKSPRNEQSQRESGFSPPGNDPNTDKNRQKPTCQEPQISAPQAISEKVRLLVIENGRSPTISGPDDPQRPPEIDPDTPPGEDPAGEFFTGECESG